MTCMDGSATGFGAYVPSAWNGYVLFVLDGGGFCFDQTSCSRPADPLTVDGTLALAVLTGTKPTTAQAPFVVRKKYAASDFATDHSDPVQVPFFPPATVGPDANGASWTKAPLNRGFFDHTSPINPFRAYMTVFIPYCTGDFHVGSKVDTSSALPARVPSNITFYGLQDSSLTFDLVLSAARRALGRAPAKIVVSGGSAGALGAMLLYGVLRAKVGPDSRTTQIITISDAGVPLSSGRSADGVAWASGGQGFWGFPGAQASQVASMEEWMYDAWGESALAAFYPAGLVTAPLADGHALLPVQDVESNVVAAASNAVSGTYGDRFGVIAGTSDWLYWFFTPLMMTDDLLGRRPTIADAETQIVNAVPGLTFFAVASQTVNGFFPYFKHHGFLLDDVSVWSTTGVTGFLSRFPL